MIQLIIIVLLVGSAFYKFGTKDNLWYRFGKWTTKFWKSKNQKSMEERFREQKEKESKY